MPVQHDGFVYEDNYYMVRCGVCKCQNHPVAVNSGMCAFCDADGRTPSQKAKQELQAFHQLLKTHGNLRPR